ncbi:hypothetical protein PR048_003776 [Dryococelus australis]|uniref:Mitochondrial protein n=1 Tax=Dryococelus australis TaxID=614101 RepID=A0ABQ9IPV9_9NEOP|nr:hypothetical protein PR048_003776 [Dryococelus australis]
MPEEYDKVIVYADEDWGGDRTDSKSMSRMAFYCGNLVTWGSKKQQAVALSLAEAEYIAGSSLAATKLVYLKGLLSEFVGSKGYVKCGLLVDN